MTSLGCAWIQVFLIKTVDDTMTAVGVGEMIFAIAGYGLARRRCLSIMYPNIFG